MHNQRELQNELERRDCGGRVVLAGVQARAERGTRDIIPVGRIV